MAFELRAPAKINWFLAVIGKRADGYHDIVSPMQAVDLFDTLSFEPSDEIEVVSDLDLPATENLVYKAAVLLRRTFSHREGARIVLKKEIPSAAGLGGGSSDAASTLLGLKRLWGLDAGSRELCELGAEIGSDVPFFLGGRLSLIEGRGERVTPLKTGPALNLLLVKPDISVSTAWAYGAMNAELTKKSIDIKLFCQSLERKDFPSLRRMVFNDLESAVVGRYGIIGGIKDLLIENGALLSSMSGSGPTVFGVFDSVAAALEASRKMDPNWCRVVETLV